VSSHTWSRKEAVSPGTAESNQSTPPRTASRTKSTTIRKATQDTDIRTTTYMQKDRQHTNTRTKTHTSRNVKRNPHSVVTEDECSTWFHALTNACQGMYHLVRMNGGKHKNQQSHIGRVFFHLLWKWFYSHKANTHRKAGGVEGERERERREICKDREREREEEQ
jgi:hypothetical protein